MMAVMEPIFIKVLNMSLTAGITICIVMLMRLLLRRAPKIFSYILWAVVLFRLLCPVSFSSAVSFFNLLQMPSVQQGEISYIPENIVWVEEPAVDFPVSGIEDAVNASLPPAEVTESVNPMQIVLWAGMHIWMSGIIIMTIYALFSYWKLRRKLKQAVWKRDNLYYTEAVETPFVCGFFAPRIYLPTAFSEEAFSGAEDGEGNREKNYILLHEQIHIKRRDYIWRIISYFALCLHWFNPLVWLAFFLSGKDMEMSCDEAVVRILGNDVKKEYSASLLSLASGRKIKLTIPLAFGEGETGSRIKNVLRYHKPTQAVIGVILVACVLIMVALAANPGSFGKEGANGADTEVKAGNADESAGTNQTGGVDAADSRAEVYYGVVSYIDLEGIREVVTIPGLGDVEMPEAEEVYPYIEIESFTKPEEGDLLAITFPQGSEVSLQEVYPAVFSIPAQSIAVMGQGFALRRTDAGAYLFTVPWGYAQEAEEGSTIVIYYYTDIKADGGVKTHLATVPVLSVDVDNYDVWVELSVEEARTFLENFGHGIECEVIEKGGSRSADAEWTAEGENMLSEWTFGLTSKDSIADGTYRVYACSLSRSAGGIDRYIADGAKDADEEPFLAFSQDCRFMVNREMESLRYEEVSFDEFADLMQETFFYRNPPVLLTFEEGQIVEAVLENYYGAGISFAALSPDKGYADADAVTQLISEEELNAYYTLENQIYLDVADSEGMERIEVYAGNTGDVDSGIVFFKSAQQEDLFSALYAIEADISRSGWNNIYLGYLDGVGFIMELHMEDRDGFGEYDYYVFRLSENGTLQQIAGSSFIFNKNEIPYDDTLFAEWIQNLGKYLEKSGLILSTQDGVLRTEMVSEAEKYTYETLKPDK